MSQRILTIYHNIGKEDIEHDMVNYLPFDVKIVRNIEENIKVPLMHTLMNLPIKDYIIANIKDLNILNILFDDSVKNYDGILFLDMNKRCSDIDQFVSIIDHCCDNNTILGTKFKSGTDINNINLHKTSTNKLPNGILFIPSGRIDEFRDFRISCLKETINNMLRWFESGETVTNANGNLLSRKWKYMNKGNDDYVSAFSELIKEMKLNYGFVEENCALGTKLNNVKLKNVMIMDFYTTNVYDEYGDTVRFTGNKLISSSSFDSNIKIMTDPLFLSNDKPKYPNKIKRKHSYKCYEKSKEILYKLLKEELINE